MLPFYSNISLLLLSGNKPWSIKARCGFMVLLNLLVLYPLLSIASNSTDANYPQDNDAEYNNNFRRTTPARTKSQAATTLYEDNDAEYTPPADYPAPAWNRARQPAPQGSAQPAYPQRPHYPQDNDADYTIGKRSPYYNNAEDGTLPSQQQPSRPAQNAYPADNDSEYKPVRKAPSGDNENFYPLYY